jgi:GT2 family glycosyltransferase
MAIVPFKDKVQLTRVCYEGLIAQELDQIELLIVLADNNSMQAETHAWLQSLPASPLPHVTVRTVRYQTPFNFSYLNNRALRDFSSFSADVVAFINNDIEFTHLSIIKDLSRIAMSSSEVGAVGCTLLYPDRRIHHLFIYVGSKIVGSHPLRGKTYHPSSPWFRNIREVPGITGAVMFVRADDFQAVGGFDETLATSYQDFDLCLKLQKLGRKNQTVPYVVNVHHETQTRPTEINWEEAVYAHRKWGRFLGQNPSIPRVYSRLSENLVPGIPWLDQHLSFLRATPIQCN